MNFRINFLAVIASVSVFFPSLAQAQGCACGLSKFEAEFQIRSNDPRTGDKAVFTGEYPAETTPNLRIATYSQSAKFWVVGAPGNPIYQVEVTRGGESTGSSAGRTIVVSLPCGFEYRNSSGKPEEASWRSAREVAVFLESGEESKSFEIKIEGSSDQGTRDSQEVGGFPEYSANPETKAPDPGNSNQPTGTGDRGFSINIPLGRLEPAGSLERRESAGALILSTPSDISDLLDLSNLDLITSSAVSELPPPPPGGNGMHVYEGPSHDPETQRTFISPSSTIRAYKFGPYVYILSYNNSGAYMGVTWLEFGSASTVSGLEPPVKITSYNPHTGQLREIEIATNASATNVEPTIVSIKEDGERRMTEVQQLEQPDCFNQIVESTYRDLPGGGEVCTSMTVSHYIYDEGRKLLVYQRSDLDGDYTTEEGPTTTWTYYDSSASSSLRGRVRSTYSSESGAWRYYGYRFSNSGDSSVVYEPFLSTAMPADGGGTGSITSLLNTFNSTGTAGPLNGTRRSVTTTTMLQQSSSQSETITSITDNQGNTLVASSPESAWVSGSSEVTIGSNGLSASWVSEERGTAAADGTGFVALVDVSTRATHWRTTVVTGTVGLGGYSLGAPAGFRAHSDLSTRTRSISNAIGTILESTEIFTGGTNFAEASVTSYTYTPDGKPLETQVDGRTVSRYAYLSNNKVDHWGRDGVKTRSIYSSSGRLLSSVRGEGQGGTPVITTTYQQNGLTSTTLVNGVSVNSVTVDRAGRTLSQTDALGRLTTSTYTSPAGGGSTITTTLPGGLTTVQSSHRDGSTASLTGSATVPSYYSYSIQELDPGAADWVLFTTTSPTPVPGGRYQRTRSDPTGYITAVHSPSLSPSSQNTEAVTVQTYDTNNWISSTQRYFASSTGAIEDIHDVETAGSVNHPEMGSSLPTPAGAMGMATVSGVHARGPEEYLEPSDRNYQVARTQYVLLDSPEGGGSVWTRQTTVTRTLNQIDESDNNQTTTDTRISWVSLNQANGDFQQIQADGDTIWTTTTYNPELGTQTTTQTSLSSGTSTSISVAGFLSSTTPSLSDGAETFHQYDSFGRQVRTVDIRGRASQTKYNAIGQVIATIDHAGAKTSYTYYPAAHQNAGALQTQTDPLGRSSIYSYNARGQVLSVTGTANYPLSYTYTPEGELETLTTTNQQGTTVTKWEYHPRRAGLVTKKIFDTSNPAEFHSYSYLGFGQVKTNSQLNRDREYTINLFGDISSTHEDKEALPGQPAVTDQNRLTYEYNSYGLVNKVIQEVKHPSSGSNAKTLTYYYLYHPNGALASETRDSHSFSSTDLLAYPSRISYTQDSDQQSRHDSYEIEADITTFAGSDWTTLGGTRYSYDAKGRLNTVASNTSGTLAQNPPNLTHTYAYHQNSAIPESITSNNIFKSTYLVDRLGRTKDVLSYSLVGNAPLRTFVGYTYNKGGQRIRATREDGNYWQYDYNTRGEVTSSKKHQAGAGQPLGGLQFEYDYDAIGNRTQMRYGGDKNGENLRAIVYDSNSLNQYTNITHPGSHHITGLAGLTGQPPAPGVIEINDLLVTANEFQGAFFSKELQEANANNPLLVPIEIEETANAGGNSTSETFGDVFVPQQDTAPQYENGNLISDGRWIYRWDTGNRLQRMTPTPQASAAHSAAGHSTELPTLDFLYDWRGRRISKRVTYGSGNTATTTITSFIYDGWNIVATVSGEEPKLFNPFPNLEIVRSDWGLDLSGSFQGAGGVGGLLATRTTDSNFTGGWPGGTYINTETARHFPSYDGNGNIIAWTTDTGGTTTTRDFDAFGNVVTNQGTRWSASTAFGFSTKYEDVETGLLYYGYRYYDPVTGRWPSRDPIGERGGVNLYGMVGNDAVNHIDLLGNEIIVNRRQENGVETTTISIKANIEDISEGYLKNRDKGISVPRTEAQKKLIVSKIKAQLQNTLALKTADGKRVCNVNLSLEWGKVGPTLGENEHSIYIVNWYDLNKTSSTPDAPSKYPGIGGRVDRIGGRVMVLNNYFCVDDIKTPDQFSQTAVHEIGHMLGLRHPKGKKGAGFDPVNPIVINPKTNFMGYALNANKAEWSQIDLIVRKYTAKPCEINLPFLKFGTKSPADSCGCCCDPN